MTAHDYLPWDHERALAYLSALWNYPDLAKAALAQACEQGGCRFPGVTITCPFPGRQEYYIDRWAA